MLEQIDEVKIGQMSMSIKNSKRILDPTWKYKSIQVFKYSTIQVFKYSSI